MVLVSQKQLLPGRNHNAALLGDMLEKLMREALRCLVGKDVNITSMTLEQSENSCARQCKQRCTGLDKDSR